jgi:hypothetical protein
MMWCFRWVLAAVVVVTVGVSGAQAQSAAACDRACLRTMLDQYLNAVIAHDPSKAPLILGFRQTDVAFMSTTTHGATLTSDFVVGLRRVRTGYTVEEALTGELAPVGGGPGGAGGAALMADGDRVRVIGREIHATWGYNVLFDPAGSHVAVAVWRSARHELRASADR